MVSRNRASQNIRSPLVTRNQASPRFQISFGNAQASSSGLPPPKSCDVSERSKWLDSWLGTVASEATGYVASLPTTGSLAQALRYTREGLVFGETEAATSRGSRILVIGALTFYPRKSSSFSVPCLRGSGFRSVWRYARVARLPTKKTPVHPLGESLFWRYAFHWKTLQLYVSLNWFFQVYWFLLVLLDLPVLLPGLSCRSCRSWTISRPLLFFASL